MLGIVLLIVLVLGGIYGIGSFRISPTEAAGFGSLLALVITVLIGRMNVKRMYQALLESARTATMIMFVILGASVFNLFMRARNSFEPWLSRASMRTILRSFLG